MSKKQVPRKTTIKASSRSQKKRLHTKNKEEKYLTIIEGALDGISICDCEGKIIETNKAYCQMIGFSKNELLKMTWGDIDVLETPALVKHHIKKIFQKGTERFETKHKRKNGKIIDVDVSARVLDKDKGLFVSFIKDITEHKKQEAALQRSYDKARTYLDLAGTMFVALDTKGKITMINQKSCQVLGYKEKELIGKDWFTSCLPQRLRKEVKQVFYKIMRGELKPVEFYENPILTKDGKERLVLWHNTNIKDSNGKIKACLSSGEDITEKKSSEETLKQSEENYRLIFETASSMITSVDNNGVIVDCNQRVKDIVGYKPHEIKGQPMSKIIHPDYMPKANESLKEILAKGYSYNKEYKMVRKDGQFIDVSINSTAIKNSDGNHKRTICLIEDITQKKKTEIELRESEEKFRLLYENSPFGIVVCELITNNQGKAVDLMHIQANPATKKHTGFDLNKIIGKRALEIASPEEIETPLRFYEQVVKTGGSATYTQHFKVYNKTLDVTAFPLEGNKFIISFNDITAKKHAEEALKRSEEKHRSLFETSRDAIMTLSPPSWRFTSGNPATVKMFNAKDESDFTSLGPWDVSPEFQPCGTPSRDKAKAMIAKAMEQGSHFFEWTQKRIDGEVFPATVLLTRLKIERQELLQATVRDISEQKNMEIALRMSQQRYSSIVENIGIGIALLSPDFKILELNAKMRQWFPDIKINDSPICYESYNTPPRDTPCEYCPCIKTLEDGQVHEAITETPMGDKVLNFRIIATPVKDENGKITSVIEMTEDITEQRQMQIQLAQTDRMASVGLLAAGVAHEINNPMTYLLYNLEAISIEMPQLAQTLQSCYNKFREYVGPEQFDQVIASGEGPSFDPSHLDELKSMAEHSLDGACRIREIIRDLKTFSHVDDSRLLKISINDCVKHALSMAKNEMKYRAMIQQDLQQVPKITANEGKLSQVFLNLFINATHAIDEGKLEQNTISIKTWAEEAFVYAEIKDTGKGIAPDKLARVFDPFFTTKEAGVGSGLGLSICHNIIVGFGGAIEVESRLNEGSCFTIKLPIESPELKISPELKDTFIEKLEKKRLHILVVDDEPNIGRSIHRMLHKQHDVVTTTSGKEAINLIDNGESFDLIICDLMMPGMSGMDVYQWLVENNHEKIADRIVFITGGVFTPRGKDFLATVKNTSIEKPFDPKAFKDVIKNIT